MERVFPLVPESIQQVEEMNALFTRFLPEWRATSTFEMARSANKLVELARIRNRRGAYIKDGVEVSIGHVEGLGEFLEVELPCGEDADTRKALAKIRTVVSRF